MYDSDEAFQTAVDRFIAVQQERAGGGGDADGDKGGWDSRAALVQA
jgi:hypothetical protein